MVHSLVRTLVSLALGAALAIGIMAGSQLLSAAPAFAQSLDGGEFADEFQTENQENNILGLIQVSLGFIGIVAIVMIIMGAVTYMTAGGNDPAQVSGRNMFATGLITLALIISIWAITTFVAASLIGANQ